MVFRAWLAQEYEDCQKDCLSLDPSTNVTRIAKRQGKAAFIKELLEPDFHDTLIKTAEELCQKTTN